MAVRVSSVAEPMCGSSVTFGSASSAARHLRLVGVDVEPGAGDPALAQRRDQRRLVDHVAAGGVDEIGGRLHRGEQLGRDRARGSTPPPGMCSETTSASAITASIDGRGSAGKSNGPTGERLK